MPNKYAIVRVDKDYYLNSCPAGFENINNDFVCSYKKSKTLNSLSTNCKKCRYGDTKEQLIKKVAQVLFIRKVKLYKKVWGCDMGSIEKEDRYKQCLKIAEEIVEFLGVEE